MNSEVGLREKHDKRYKNEDLRATITGFEIIFGVQWFFVGFEVLEMEQNTFIYKWRQFWTVVMSWTRVHIARPFKCGTKA